MLKVCRVYQDKINPMGPVGMLMSVGLRTAAAQGNTGLVGLLLRHPPGGVHLGRGHRGIQDTVARLPPVTWYVIDTNALLWFVI